jgi:hypothetical protein
VDILDELLDHVDGCYSLYEETSRYHGPVLTRVAKCNNVDGGILYDTR